MVSEWVLGLTHQPAAGSNDATHPNGTADLTPPAQSPQSVVVVCDPAASEIRAQWLAAGCRDGTVIVLDRRSGGVLACWQAHASALVSLVAVSPSHLLSSSTDRNIKMWDLSSFEPSFPASTMSHSTLVPSLQRPTAAAVSPSKRGSGNAQQAAAAATEVVSGSRPVASGSEDSSGRGSSSARSERAPSWESGEVAAPRQPCALSWSEHGGPAAAAGMPLLLIERLVQGPAIQGMLFHEGSVLGLAGSQVAFLAELPAVAPSPAGRSRSSPAPSPKLLFTRLQGVAHAAALTGLALLPCCQLVALVDEEGRVLLCR